MHNIHIILSIIALILIFNYLIKCSTYCKCNSKLESFVDDYYSFNWISPTLIDDVNTEKIVISGKGCSLFNSNNSTNSNKGNQCTYSMSCDYSNDTAHSRCFAGYDMPGTGDLDIPPSFLKFNRNQSI